VINKYHRTLYILEIKRSSDRNENFLGVKEDEADEQHKSIIEALKAAAPEWTFEYMSTQKMSTQKLIYMNSYIFHICFMFFIFLSNTYLTINFYMLDVIIGRYTWILSPYR